MPLSAAEIRRSYIDFFVREAGHTEVESTPVVPHNDPTLLFTNAGMNQFKDVFLGQGSRPYSRAVDTQRCIRAGGKHNDLEDVGRDTYHHTFFEMLGNWSLGDYFKEEAIRWAWQFLTDEMGIDGDRLYATYFEGKPDAGLEADEEARALWLRYLPESHVLPFGMKDNFWEMGETGPCGPCSEIHYDRIGGRDASPLVNQDDPNVLEIWNLVFIQFNREGADVLKPLPAQHVDTGMGFERLVSVLQDKLSNYDTDLFAGLFASLAAITGTRAYGGVLDDPTDVAYRIIADHARCLTAALADGATPGADGRGYVLRRILRRAVRHGRQTLGVKEPFLAKLVPAVVDSLGDAFGVLRAKQHRVEELIEREEETFRRTLDRGLALFATAAEQAKADGTTTLSGEDAFALHDTFGFPIDLTHVMAEENGLTVDTAGYERLMDAARTRSRAGSSDVDRVRSMPPGVLEELATSGVKPTNDSFKNAGEPTKAAVRAIWMGEGLETSAATDARVAVVLDRTPFYAEQGGQQGDVGELVAAGGTLAVEDTQRVGAFVLHIGRVRSGTIAAGDSVEAILESDVRDEIRKNHTVTHLLNNALRAIAGEESDQRGSLVAADRLRFDYAARGPLTPEQLEAIEAHVRDAIEQGHTVHAEDVPLEDARSISGVRAIFGEQYPDPVRVVSIGPDTAALLAAGDSKEWSQCSIEFCGGTHLQNSAEAEAFVLVSEQGLAAGVRRVTALAGKAAQEAIATSGALEARIAAAEAEDDASVATTLDLLAADFETATISTVARHRLADRLEGLHSRAKSHRKASQAENRGSVVEAARALAASEGPAIVGQLDGADRDALLAAMDAIRAARSDAAVLLLGANHDQGKVTIVAKVPKKLIEQGLKAGEWVKAAAQACGGGGGGRPDSAQAGGKDPARAGEAEDAARLFAREKLGATA